MERDICTGSSERPGQRPGERPSERSSEKPRERPSERSVQRQTGPAGPRSRESLRADYPPTHPHTHPMRHKRPTVSSHPTYRSNRPVASRVTTGRKANLRTRHTNVSTESVRLGAVDAAARSLSVGNGGGPEWPPPGQLPRLQRFLLLLLLPAGGWCGRKVSDAKQAVAAALVREILLLLQLLLLLMVGPLLHWNAWVHSMQSRPADAAAAAGIVDSSAGRGDAAAAATSSSRAPAVTAASCGPMKMLSSRRLQLQLVYAVHSTVDIDYVTDPERSTAWPDPTPIGVAGNGQP